MYPQGGQQPQQQPDGAYQPPPGYGIAQQPQSQPQNPYGGQQQYVPQGQYNNTQQPQYGAPSQPQGQSQPQPGMPPTRPQQGFAPQQPQNPYGGVQGGQGPQQQQPLPQNHNNNHNQHLVQHHQPRVSAGGADPTAAQQSRPTPPPPFTTTHGPGNNTQQPYPLGPTIPRQGQPQTQTHSQQPQPLNQNSQPQLQPHSPSQGHAHANPSQQPPLQQQGHPYSPGHHQQPQQPPGASYSGGQPFPNPQGHGQPLVPQGQQPFQSQLGPQQPPPFQPQPQAQQPGPYPNPQPQQQQYQPLPQGHPQGPPSQPQPFQPAHPHGQPQHPQDGLLHTQSSPAVSTPTKPRMGVPMFGPPPGKQFAQAYLQNVEKPNMMSWQQQFQVNDKDKSGFLSLLELETMVIGPVQAKFTPDTARALMKLFDADGSGQIEMNEFAAMSQFVTQLHSAFNAEDKDRSRKLSVLEVQSALARENLHYDALVVEALVKRYSRVASAPQMGHARVHAPNASHPSHPKGSLTFEEFVHLSAVIANARHAFHSRDPQQSGMVHLTQEDFIAILADL